MKITNFESKHFTLQPLAEGVYATIATDGGFAVCNAGLIDLGNLVLVYDTFVTPMAAEDLLRAGRELFGQKPMIVIDSHSHNDHTWGNQVFLPDCLIFSSKQTRELMVKDSPGEVEWYQSHVAQKVTDLEAKLLHISDEKERFEAFIFLGEYKGILASLPDLAVSLPNVTFEDSLTFCGQKSDAELINFNNGHTACDTVLYLPKEGVLFMSDLLFINFHPYLGDGDPDGLIDALQHCAELPARFVVPGHGPVGNRDHILQMIDYVKDCEKIAQGLMETNGDKDELSNAEVPVYARDWNVPSFFNLNIRFVYEKLRQTQSK